EEEPAVVEAAAGAHEEHDEAPSSAWEAPSGSVREDAVTETVIVGAVSPATPTAIYGNPDATPLTDLYPLPSGKPIYEGLKSAFVDFPKLLRTLDADKHTGYVRLDGADFAGVLLLHDGHVLEAL